MKTHYLYRARRYRILAVFPETDSGTRMANAACEAVEGASVLVAEHGWIILAHEDDVGIPCRRTARTDRRDPTEPDPHPAGRRMIVGDRRGA